LNNCNHQLSDSKGKDGLTFVEKVTNNLPVLGVGAGLGVLGIFLYNKISK
jgi:hypothetical protein